MVFIDWLILVIYLFFSLVLGLLLVKKNTDSEEYFVAGRTLKGWLAGASMAATTFSIDTPLYVAGIIGTRGLAGNWEWWSFGLAHVAMTVIFAPMWRRSGVLTDAAFAELRYGGQAAAWLRGVKAFLLAVPVNCIGIGYAFLAMRKVCEALEIVDGHQVFSVFTDTSILLFIVASFMLFYTVAGGFWAVVVNDFVQLLFALIGALIVSWVALGASGGMSNLLFEIKALDRPELLSMFPWTWSDRGFQWIDNTGITFTTFAAFISLQWWSFRRSDGGGEFIQRLLATKNEKEATIAGGVFLVVNYLLRSWLWILVGLSALILLPEQSDWELSYPKLALEYLPHFALGLVFVSLVAAFMSTISTSINWGSSYLTYDLYRRFIRPEAGKTELIFIAQLASISLLILGIIMALISNSIGSVFRLVIAIGTGPGVVLVLRWFWWRINAWAELASMVSGFVIGLTTSLVPSLIIPDYGIRLLFTTGFTSLIWLLTLLITKPESAQVLNNFVLKVRPPGPGWRVIRNRMRVKPVDSLAVLFLRFVSGSGILYGFLLSIGFFLLHQSRGGWICLALGVFSCLFMNRSKLIARSLASD